MLYNFKGEPNYVIKDFLPDYYEQAIEIAKTLKDALKEEKRAAEKTAKREEKAIKIEQAEHDRAQDRLHYIAIDDPRSDTYYRGTYDANTERLELHPTRSKTKLDDFLIQNGQPVPEAVPNWTVEYNFDSDTIFDPEARTINLYRRTEYLRNPTPSKSVPPTITRLLQHVFGYNEACVEHFLNWVACIVQHRTRTLSAWVLSGTQGTGKGSLFSDVLAPLIGEEHVCDTDLPALQGDFNGFIEGKLLVLIDESEASELRERRKVMARLKRLVTERSIQINRKGQNQYSALNRANFILASNKHDPVEVDAGDRRFSVAPRQEQKILDKWGGPMTLKEITRSTQ